MQPQQYPMQQQGMPIYQPQGMPMQQIPMQQQQYPNQNLPYQMQQQNMPMMQQQGMPIMQQQGIPMIQQQPMVMVPGNPLNFMSALDKLAAVPGVFIKQKFELLEALTGCETQNKYKVWANHPDGNKSKQDEMFKCKEKSNCLARICLKGDCRPFKMNVYHESSGQSSTDGTDAFKFYRDYRFTCCCFNRPVLEVRLTENGQDIYLGKVKSPCVCCELELEIYDQNDQLKYYVNGSCCQLGIWCQFPCEPCQTIDFQVLDSSRNPLSQLQKRTAGCLKAAISDADNFSLIFPQNSTKEDRALLMAAVIMLDFTYFEENNQNQSN